MTMLAAQSANSQSRSTRLPRFTDYPVKDVFHEPPHRPILVTPEQRRYRTRIREGVDKAWGVWINGEWGHEQKKREPNFAGHYMVIVWGCGAPCLMMAVCNAKTGVVYDPPLTWTGGLALPLLVFQNSAGRAADVDYRRDSRLMIINATPHASDRRDAVSYTFYFLWQDNRWALLRRVPIIGE